MANITRRGLALLAGAGLVAGCASARQADTTPKETIVVSDNPIRFFDMHADTIDVLGMKDYPPYSEVDGVFTGTLAENNCEISLDRIGTMRWAQCYAIWIPDDVKKISHHDWYTKAAAYFKDQMKVCADVLTQPKSLSEIPGILDAGKVAAVLTVENAACLGAGIEVVDEFVKDGVLIAGITWNGKNVLGSGNESKDGLTDLGRSYVRALEERNIVVDVSHLNDAGFWDVDKMAARPYVATHSNSRSVCDVPRNLTDEQFCAIADRGGLVGLNLHKDFVYKEGATYDFDLLCKHVEHWLDLGGEDVIAFGTDRDGAELPSWLVHCSSQEFVFKKFAERLGDELARKLFFDNAMAYIERYEADSDA